MMEIVERLYRIKLLCLDVDGILTDGRIHIDDNGVETKTFDVTDGLGIALLRKAGVEVAIITGRTSEVVKLRAKELGIEHLSQGVRDKAEVLEELIGELGISTDNVAFMGDDLVDLPAITKVGLGVTVPAAPEDVKLRSHLVTGKPGGRGAVRELCEAILKAKGEWDRVTSPFINTPPLVIE
ncbi:MAG: phenylphosphate carboxylase subunit delta [Deltaproteobacteria bacterium]|nr:MAG: phenylphosphate carboxylase subunit delta [Deltaproteobacteria bacterium]